MIRIDQHPTHWTVWMDAPATRNALTADMVKALQDIVQDTPHHPSLRALVLRGAGGQFCAGGDFASFQDMMATPAPSQGDDPIAVSNRAFGHLLDTLSECPVMTLAVVQGAAMGGGCGLAAACDVVIADDTAVMATPELTLGLPPAQIAPFLQRRMGHARAMQWLMRGTNRFDVARAVAHGLVDEQVPDVEAALQAWAQHWQRAEPAALRATVQILRQARSSQSLPRTLDFAAQQFAQSLRSGTASEGLAARQAKRPPRWAEP